MQRTMHRGYRWNGYEDMRFGHARRIGRTEEFRDNDEIDDKEIVNVGSYSQFTPRTSRFIDGCASSS